MEENEPFLITSEETARTQFAAWHKGLNPHPRLTMDESWTLMHLMRYGCQSQEGLDTFRRLLRKSCGMEDETS